jgi:hypothetical protein
LPFRSAGTADVAILSTHTGLDRTHQPVAANCRAAASTCGLTSSTPPSRSNRDGCLAVAS